jgi:hypothetical protein
MGDSNGVKMLGDRRLKDHGVRYGVTPTVVQSASGHGCRDAGGSNRPVIDSWIGDAHILLQLLTPILEGESMVAVSGDTPVTPRSFMR